MLTLTHVCTRMKEELYTNKNNAVHADTNETTLKGTPWSKSQRPGVCLQLNYSALSSFHIYHISQIVHWGTLFTLEVLILNFCLYFRQGLALLLRLVSSYKVQVILLPQPPEELTAQSVLPYPVWI